MTWHVPPAALAAYAREALADAEAWSVEAHLVRCPACRAGVAREVASTPLAPVLQVVRSAVECDLPVASRHRRSRPLLTALAGPAGGLAWLVTALALLAAAAGLDALGVAPPGSRPGVTGAEGWWFVLVAPLVPVLGVAASYGPAVDPAYEVAAAAPAGGLRLLLRRTLLVLATALPAGLLLAGPTGGGAPAAWLLPGLALTATTLALGPVLGLLRAGALVGLAWVLLVAAPLVGGGPATAGRGPAWAWAAGALLAAAVVAARRRAYATLPPDGPR